MGGSGREGETVDNPEPTFVQRQLSGRLRLHCSETAPILEVSHNLMEPAPGKSNNAPGAYTGSDGTGTYLLLLTADVKP
ncbi:MAG TPA: hypothetical protein VEZ90_20120 [Blastocatellia bacterium]|nr:hypothetical protein [Blastocatellia bacterium]